MFKRENLGGMRVKIIFDPDIPKNLIPYIKQAIEEAIEEPCECGCDEVYASMQSENNIDVKCYDCGTSYFELEIEEVEVEEIPENSSTIVDSSEK